jgi:hypothetical protein
MKIVDMTDPQFSLTSLLALLEQEDILLMENGHPKARLEKFDEEDWADWLFEHDPQVIREAERERQRLRDGQGVAWTELEAQLDAEDSET